MNTSTIPVINIENIDNPATLKVLDAACRDWGFCQVTHHGIDPNLITAIFEQTRAFFAQPSAIKREIARTANNTWGFFDQELTKNKRDWKEIFDYGPADGQTLRPQWPRLLPRFEPVVRTYYAACERLAHTLLAAISSNLGMPSDYLKYSFGRGHTSFLRMNYYPVYPGARKDAVQADQEGDQFGVHHHTDAGALTLLLQDDVAGLEVFRNGGWHLVEPRSDALVINIGDIVQVWSNDRYKASLHRVTTNVTRERFSIPFFFNPAHDAQYAPLPTTIDDAHPARYVSINWGNFRALRAAGDFADLGEEIQISHFSR
jgi:isopenicillin N synthase-like dioxygenase